MGVRVYSDSPRIVEFCGIAVIFSFQARSAVEEKTKQFAFRDTDVNMYIYPSAQKALF